MTPTAPPPYQDLGVTGNSLPGHSGNMLLHEFLFFSLAIASLLGFQSRYCPGDKYAFTNPAQSLGVRQLRGIKSGIEICYLVKVALLNSKLVNPCKFMSKSIR